MASVFEQRRADPTQGVLETMLVLDGEPVELAGHLARLRGSLGELYGHDLPPGLVDEIRARCRGVERGKARVVATPTSVTVKSQSLVGDFLSLSGNNSPTAVALHSLTVPGGLGPHKWADRSLLDEAAVDLPADDQSLIVDRDGAALEASRANLFAVRGGALFTPPLDGRILPGVTRARVLALAPTAGIEVREEGLTRADLYEATGVFLSGSVRGIEPVHSLDGEALARDDKTITRLTSALCRAWNDTHFG